MADPGVPPHGTGGNGTFQWLMEHYVNPYANLSDQCNLYSTANQTGIGGAAGVAEVHSYATSTAVTQGFMLQRADGRPWLALKPTPIQALPGSGEQDTVYAMIGDYSASGLMGNLVSFPQAMMARTTTPVRVPTRDHAMAVWDAERLAGRTRFPAMADGAADSDRLITRTAGHIPHERAGRILAQDTAGNLTLEWLIGTELRELLADPNLVQLYPVFINHLLFMAAHQEQADPADAPQVTQICIDPIAAETSPRVKEKWNATARLVVPGRMGMTLAETELLRWRHDDTTRDDARIQREEQRTIDAADKKKWGNTGPTVHLACSIQKLSEADPLAPPLPLWKAYGELLGGGGRAGQFLGILEDHLRAEATKRNMSIPILSPAVMTDAVTGRLVSANITSVMEGIYTPYRLLVAHMTGAEAAVRRNQVYNAMAMNTATGNMDAQQMVAADNEVMPIVGSTEFRQRLEAFLIWLIVTNGMSRAVTEYELKVIQKLGTLIDLTQQWTKDPDMQNWVFNLIAVWSMREFNAHSTLLLQQPRWVAGEARPPLIPVPDFEEALRLLMRAKIVQLTTIPSGLMIAREPVPLRGGGGRPPSQALGAPQAPPVGHPQPLPGQANGTLVTRPNENMNIRTKWANTHNRSIFGVGSPFHDPAAVDHKVIIMSDVLGVRICLPMTLTGRCYSNCGGKHGQCSATENDRVCAGGGMPLEGA